VQLVVSDGLSESRPDNVLVVVEHSRPEAHICPPTVNPGICRQPGDLSQTVELDGTCSFDVDGDELRYRWSFTSRPAGSSAALADPEAAVTSFGIDVLDSTYGLQLLVEDDDGLQATDTVFIDSINNPPVADAGPDQVIESALLATVSLDGSGFDCDGDPLTYSWALIAAPSGTGATLSDPTAVSPTLSTVDGYGIYVAQLIVSDGQEESVPDTATIGVIPPLPALTVGMRDETLVLAPGESADLTVEFDGNQALLDAAQPFSVAGYEMQIQLTTENATGDIDSWNVALGHAISITDPPTFSGTVNPPLRVTRLQSSQGTCASLSIRVVSGSGVAELQDSQGGSLFVDVELLTSTVETTVVSSECAP
jgi:hypothetical protein